MVLTTALLSLVVGTTAFAFLGANDASRGVGVRVENLSAAQTLLAVMTKDLRAVAAPRSDAPLSSTNSPFESADAQEAVFYASLYTTGAPNRIQLVLDRADPVNPQVREVVTPPDDPNAAAPTYGALPSVTRYVGEHVANTSGQPIFIYYDGAGATLPTPLSEADRIRVRAVGISLSVRRQTDLKVEPTTVVTRVRLTNILYGDRPSA